LEISTTKEVYGIISSISVVAPLLADLFLYSYEVLFRNCYGIIKKTIRVLQP
jgi:hypothetical protein